VKGFEYAISQFLLVFIRAKLEGMIQSCAYLFRVCTNKDRLPFQYLDEYRDKLLQKCGIDLWCGIMFKTVAQLGSCVDPEFNI